jgi:hypothetical protein
MTFTIDNIKDKALLEKLTKEEADIIFNSPNANKGRTYDQIYTSVRQGKIAELYLVESGAFEFANLKYHDLKRTKTGEYCEVKAYNINDWNFWKSPFVIRDIERYSKETWNKASWYYLFQCKAAVYYLVAVIRLK